MNNIFLIISFFILLISNSLFGQKKINSLTSFAKAYGYVKYFHPSAECTEINWDKFSAYGTEEILKCKDQNEVVQRLNQLFQPIGPAINFSKKQKRFNLRTITPKNWKTYKTTYWQHLGVSTGMQYQYPYNAYNSVRVNQFRQVNDTTEVIAKPIFTESPKLGELIETEIGNGIYCQIPLALYTDGRETYPKSQSINSLKSIIDNIDTKPTNLSARIGNVINVYNVIHHFYPYFDEVEVDWDMEFEKALKRCFKDKTSTDHLITLQKFTSPIKDGHIWIWQGQSPYNYYPPIQWEWIQNSLVITDVLDDNLDIKVGDVVTKVNNQSAYDYIKEVSSRISAGTDTYLYYSAKNRCLSAEKDKELLLEINNKKITLQHNKNSKEYSFNSLEIQKQMYKNLGNDIMYLNLGAIHNDTIIKLLPKLSQMKGLICDFRGHNWRIWNFVSHFMKNDTQAENVMKIPKIIYPNQERMVGYKESGWNYTASKPYLGHVKTVFIVDGRTKSSAESFMMIVKSFNLATIVGEQTAGANGNMNPFKMLGDISMYWTGMKVVNTDGSQFHTIGIIPDITVEKTIDGIKAGKDEFLEKAIEIITNK